MAKYLKPDSDLGYIENSAEIEYLKLNNLRHSILGFMLGDFDEQGFYTISTEIQKELLSMRKFIVNSVDNIDICHGAVMLDKPITFMVTFESDRATLSLVEKISYEANMELNSGTYSNVNEFILDEVETAGEINRNLVYKRWNIGEFGGEALGVAQMDATTLALYSGLVERYKYLLAANKILLEKEAELEEAEAEYSVGVIEILSRYPALKTLVNEEVKNEVKQKTKFLRLDKPNFAKTFNEILDQAIENNIGALSGSEINMFNQEKREVTQKRNMRMQAELDIKQQTTTEEESNETALDEEFGERSNKKNVLNAGNFSSRSIGELQNEFKQAETSIGEIIIDAALAYAAGKIAGKIIAGTLNQGERYGQNRQGVLDYILGVAGTERKELLGDEQQAKVAELGKQAKTSQTAEPAAAAPETKKQEQAAVAKKPAAKKQEAKKAAAKKTEAKKSEAKKPAAKKPDGNHVQARATSATTVGGGLIGRQVNPSVGEAREANLGRATERTPATHRPKMTLFDVDITEQDVRNFQKTVDNAQKLITKTNERNISGGLGPGLG